MRASTEKLSFFGGGWGERGGDGWPHLKHKKPKKNCARRAYERGSDIEKLFEKSQNKHEGFYTPFFRFFSVALRFSMRASGFFHCCCLIRDWRGEEMNMIDARL